MEDQINTALKYYEIKQQEILNKVNSTNSLTVDEIIHYGEEMAIIENKITALEVAKEN